MNNSPSMGIALITGASSGIGAVYADRLAKRGYDLVLVARDAARLEALAARVASETGRAATPLPADLNDKADLARVEGTLRGEPNVTLLVNNAGISSVASLLDADVDEMDEMIALNVTALTRLTYAAAPAFVARGGGTIINIASVLGISPETLNGVYGATKAYVLALTHSLQHELAAKGLRIQAVLPGATATDLWQTAGLPWQPPSPASTRASSSRFLASRTKRNGRVSRPPAAPSRSTSAAPYPRRDTGPSPPRRHRPPSPS
jgi:uncharacterized protein